MSEGPVPSVMLYVPATESAKADKALGLDTDAVILDLEDAVAPAAKDEGRLAAAAVLSTPGEGPQRWVRINALDGPLWADDVLAVAGPRLDGLVVPKVESAVGLAALDGALTVLERRLGLPSGRIGLIATLETPAGVLRAREIAAGSARLLALGFGAGDFSRITGLEYPAVHGGAAAVLDRARTELVLASSLAGLHRPHDSVYGNYRDLEGLRHEAKRARQMGFGGKHAIHPHQLHVLRDCLAVTDAELERAERMLAAYAEAVRAGVGAVGVDGILVDEPVARRAEQTVAARRTHRADP